nr:hypothetical protein Iba_chr10aCG2830 [Ipomoea batatas]
MKNGGKQNWRIEVNARHVTFLCDFQWISTRDRITDEGMKHGSRKSHPFFHVNSFCTFDLPIEALHCRPEGPMQHSCCKSSTRAAPPPTSKWHIIESLALQTLQFVGLNQQILLGCVRQVSLGHKLCSILPGLGVPVDCIKIHHKPRVLGDFVAVYDAILPALSENQWERWMQSQCFFHDGLEIWKQNIHHVFLFFLPIPHFVLVLCYDPIHKLIKSQQQCLDLLPSPKQIIFLQRAKDFTCTHLSRKQCYPLCNLSYLRTLILISRTPSAHHQPANQIIRHRHEPNPHITRLPLFCTIQEAIQQLHNLFLSHICKPIDLLRPGCKADVMVFEDLFSYRAIGDDIGR